jgi:hypothetical protein
MTQDVVLTIARASSAEDLVVQELVGTREDLKRVGTDSERSKVGLVEAKARARLPQWE